MNLSSGIKIDRDTQFSRTVRTDLAENTNLNGATSLHHTHTASTGYATQFPSQVFDPAGNDDVIDIEIPDTPDPGQDEEPGGEPTTYIQDSTTIRMVRVRDNSEVSNYDLSGEIALPTYEDGTSWKIAQLDAYNIHDGEFHES